MLASFTPTSSPAYVLASLMMAQIYFVHRFPAAGESLQAYDFYCETGGKGLNVLIGLHKLGIPVNGIIPCGQQNCAQQQCTNVLQQWQLEHINPVTIGEYNGNGVALIDASGQNQISVHPGANALLDATHIAQQKAQIQSAGLIYATFELPDDAIIAAFTLARAAHRPTVLNPSPYREISSALLDLTDILIMNQIETQAWLGALPTQLDSLESAAAWLPTINFTQHYPGKSFFITLGNHGAIAITNNGSIYQQPAFKTDAVDSIGAGDAFSSALLAALLKTGDVAHALKHGCASASMVIRQRGLLDNLPTPSTLQSFLSNSDPLNTASKSK